MTETFGNIKQVNVRKHWNNEAQDFTPWLAREENIRLLSEAIGIELEVENTEVAVGPYSADILARDSGTSRLVVIENQLKKTDHDHLGKLITYGAVLDAYMVIWLATDFTEEHQKALEWLNDHSTDEVSFIGVQIELWQIDDSRPAIRFNVISKPTEILRQASKAKVKEELTENRKLQLEFWQSFSQKLKATKKLPSVQTARPQYWFDVALGRSGINLSNIANTWDNKIGVRVYISTRIADLALPQLMNQKDEIEKEIGDSLLWNPNPDNQDKIIVLYRDAVLSKKDKWDEYLKWMIEKTLKFREAFAPRIKQLDLSRNSGEDNMGESE